MKISKRFTDTLAQVQAGINELMNMAYMQESEYVTDKDLDTGAYKFYDSESEEFLRVLLDLLQVINYGYPPSTFELNINSCFLFDKLPEFDQQIELHYATVVGDEREAFESVYTNKLLPHCREKGFDLAECSTVYYLIGSGEGIRFDFMSNAERVINSGFSVDEVLELFKAEARGEPESFTKEAYAGYLVDPSLGNRVRVSVWALHRTPSLNKH
ncbi:hypothetical protein [Methylomagnum ishizawai]|uniref:hypothetical protein n=1 Tax=Methylomagnum ishizawai TaxID=1760988 RepID=UPI001C33531B|nr:hypothetical protein [Methylomagnum ishizawai]BBL73690.1 hypothetical protein MishRS11D_07880 [Methylomagnum ishizawai]